MLILSYLKKCEHPLMLQRICRMANSLWSNLVFLPFGVIIDLKLSGKEKDHLQMLISIKDLGSEQQCESWSLISSWNELDHGIRHKQISNRKKTTFISVICWTSAAFDHIPKKWLLFGSIGIGIPEGESCLVSWENSATKHLLLISRLK